MTNKTTSGTSENKSIVRERLDRALNKRIKNEQMETKSGADTVEDKPNKSSQK